MEVSRRGWSEIVPVGRGSEDLRSLEARLDAVVPGDGRIQAGSSVHGVTFSEARSEYGRALEPASHGT